MKMLKRTTIGLSATVLLMASSLTMESQIWPPLTASDSEIAFTSELEGGTVARIQGSASPQAEFIVTRSDDRNNTTCVPGDCSLREAVDAAIASTTSDTIAFAPGLTTVTLGNEIVINNAGVLIIKGPGANALTIDGGAGSNRIFYTSSAHVEISGVTLTAGNGGGENYSGKGGAIYTSGSGGLTLNGVHVTGNSAAFGGGLYLTGYANIIVNSTISENIGGCGGIFFDNYLEITNSTISGNKNVGICSGEYSFEARLRLRNVTITNNANHSGPGGGIQWGGSDLNIGNTIVAGNTSDIGDNEILGSGGITSAGGNLIGDSPGDSPPGIAYQTTDIRDRDPLLGPLRNNGGTTPTHALKGRSPVIDKGLNALAFDRFGNPLAFDQRGSGYARILGRNDNPTVDIGAFEFAPNRDASTDNAGLDNVSNVFVANIEELYTAVNDPQNAGNLIIIAPGLYMLSVNDPMGAARPNGGRLELQQNMSLQGVVGNRGAVIIDAKYLPSSSYIPPPPILGTGAIRIGRGSNSIQWLTARNAIHGGANIETDLPSAGIVYISVMHVASTNSERGLDARNVGGEMAGRVIEADIVDNDFYFNRLGAQGEGLRLVNNNNADGGRITARLSDNRSYYNLLGLLVEDNGSNNAYISVISSGDQIFENGCGAVVGGGLSSGNFANGNTVNFSARASSFVNNFGFNNFDHGGLVIIGGENTVFQNGTSNNTVNVMLSGCKFANNQLFDLYGIGARSNPESIGAPGTNNHVIITRSPDLNRMSQQFTNCIPNLPELMNTVTVRNGL